MYPFKGTPSSLLSETGSTALNPDSDGVSVIGLRASLTMLWTTTPPISK